MKQFLELNITSAIQGLENKDFSATELTSFYINQIKTSNSNSFITKTFDKALEMAKNADKKISNKSKLGLFSIYKPNL